MRDIFCVAYYTIEKGLQPSTTRLQDDLQDAHIHVVYNIYKQRHS